MLIQAFILAMLLVMIGEIQAKPDVVSIKAESFQYDVKKRRILVSKDLVMTQGDVQITSESGSYDQSMSRVELLNQVVIKKGGLQATCERAVALPKDHRIELLGPIHVTYDDIRATAQEGVYHHVDQILWLSGDPKVWQNQDLLTGTRISIDIKKKVVTAVGASQAVLSSDTLNWEGQR